MQDRKMYVWMFSLISRSLGTSKHQTNDISFLQNMMEVKMPKYNKMQTIVILDMTCIPSDSKVKLDPVLN